MLSSVTLALSGRSAHDRTEPDACGRAWDGPSHRARKNLAQTSSRPLWPSWAVDLPRSWWASGTCNGIMGQRCCCEDVHTARSASIRCLTRACWEAVPARAPGPGDAPCATTRCNASRSSDELPRNLLEHGGLLVAGGRRVRNHWHRGCRLGDPQMQQNGGALNPPTCASMCRLPE